jgi:hypothetical protein
MKRLVFKFKVVQPNGVIVEGWTGSETLELAVETLRRIYPCGVIQNVGIDYGSVFVKTLTQGPIKL